MLLLVLKLEFVLILSTIILAEHTTMSVVPTAANGWEGTRAIGFTGLYTGPYFDTTTPTNITAQLGTHAFLPCKVRQLGNKSVSWIRQRDSHILTVDRYTFIADERFQVLHNSDVWTLQIKYVQPRDAGVYECQITSEPKLSQFVQMDVVIPQTEILGESDVFVKSGSTVQIKCIITQNLEQPSYIFWFHDSERVVMDDGKYEWVDRVNMNTTIGTLVIKSTILRDSGNYTCSPSNIESASVMLHILNGEHPAAMQQGSSATRLSTIFYSANNVLVYVILAMLILILNESLLASHVMADELPESSDSSSSGNQSQQQLLLSSTIENSSLTNSSSSSSPTSTAAAGGAVRRRRLLSFKQLIFLHLIDLLSTIVFCIALKRSINLPIPVRRKLKITLFTLLVLSLLGWGILSRKYDVTNSLVKYVNYAKVGAVRNR